MKPALLLSSLLVAFSVWGADRLTPLNLPETKVGGIELDYLALNPASLCEPVPNSAVRPDGIGCRVQMWKPGMGLGKKPDYELTLSEFPDPEGKATYFRLRDYSVAVHDELLSGR